MTPPSLHNIPTPALILDRAVLATNLARMSARMKNLGVNLRPHLKTAKSAHVARLAVEGHSGAITVSTLREAACFIDNGFTDITYAIPISPAKLPLVAELQKGGATVHVLADHPETAREIARHAEDRDTTFSVFIEIDSGFHRSGVAPGSETLTDIGKILHEAPAIHFMGVLTHAGHAYSHSGAEALRAAAEDERAAMVLAAQRLRDAGIPCPTVSVGATPTAAFAEHLHGVNEARPGNYMFMDLSMAGRGVCAIEDIAVSVLTTVIVNQPAINRVLVDAGSLALSSDLSAHAGPMPGVGYGLVRDIANTQTVADAAVLSVSQEQGWLGPLNGGAPLPLEPFPIGTRLRILPNHSCITAAAYAKYHVVHGGTDILATWPRANGWEP